MKMRAHMQFARQCSGGIGGILHVCVYAHCNLGILLQLVNIPTLKLEGKI